MSRPLALLLAVAALACACAGAATTPSGLQGVVTRAPTSPVCRVDVPCSGPAAHVDVVFSEQGGPVRTVRTDAQGRYRITLGAGLYTVRVPRRYGTSIRPARVAVKAAVMRSMRLAIDTGIR